MLRIGLNGEEFASLARDVFSQGRSLRFKARGNSMRPFIQDGDVLEIFQPDEKDCRLGVILLCDFGEGHLVAHRLVRVEQVAGEQRLVLQGDAMPEQDGKLAGSQVLGRVVSIQRGDWRLRLDQPLGWALSRVWFVLLGFRKGRKNKQIVTTQPPPIG
jgi:signal peptidase